MALTRPTIQNINTNLVAFSDSLTITNYGNVANRDIGEVFDRSQGGGSNVAIIWNESNQAFRLGYTTSTGKETGNIAITSNADLIVGNLRADNLTVANVIYQNTEYVSSTETVAGNSTVNGLTVNTSATVGTTLSVTGNLTTGNIVPSANAVYSLGDSTHRYKSLYLSGNTIYMDGTTISSNATSIVFTNPAGGSFTVSGATAIEANTNAGTAQYVTAAAQGNITSVGTLTGLTLSGTLIGTTLNASTFGNAGATFTGSYFNAAGSFYGPYSGVIGGGGANTALVTTLTSTGNTTVNALTVNTSATVGTTLGVTGNITAGNLSTGTAVATTANFGTVNINSSTGNYNVLNITGAALGPYGTQQWQFFTQNTNLGSAGSWIKFPDTSTQTTAYPGTLTGSNSSITLSGSATFNQLAVNTTVIATGGIQNTPIGNVTPSTGSFSNLTLGNIANLSIPGGVSGYVIKTDGSGNLSWQPDNNGGIIFTSATTPPVSGNSKGDQWYNTTTDTLYEYINDGTSYYWVDVSSPAIINTNVTTLSSPVVYGNLTVGNIISSSNITIGSNLTINTYTNHYIANGSLSNTSALTISGNVYGRGGIGYLDAITLTNNYSGATNPNKWIRVDSAGTLQIINSGYGTNIFNLTDSGVLTVPGSVSAGSVQINGNQAVNGPSFQAFLTSVISFNSGSTANVVYQSTLYDTHSCYNTSTGVFKPNVAGYYQFNWTAGANSYPASSGICTSSLRKNTQEYARGARGICNTGGYVVNGSAQCYLNGTTDYVYVTFLQGSGGAVNLEADAGAIASGGSYANYFSGSMIRGA